MDLNRSHHDLLRAVAAAEDEARPEHPGTRLVGERLVATWRERGTPYYWWASAPWHGTDPLAAQLADAGLLLVHRGRDEHRLELTVPGRARLDARGHGPACDLRTARPTASGGILPAGEQSADG